MNACDEYSKFTRSLGKFINKRWSKVRNSANSLNNLDRNIEQLLEEEYETLLKEIEYFTSEKSCHLNFKNDKFTASKSSEDLTKILRNHSQEALQAYIAQHDKLGNEHPLSNRNDLVNYVTEIVVSRPKCNNKICSCKPAKISKEVLTDNTVQKENAKETQTKHASHQATHDTGTNSKGQVDTETVQVQTDKWNHDPNCTCGCCPKTGVTTKSTLTLDKVVQDASTDGRKNTSSKKVYANCSGGLYDAQTSTNRLCVPENFETLLKSNQFNFTACAGKQDCECEAYDVKEAVKRGLVLPSSDICIQTKKKSVKQKKKSSQKGKQSVSSDDTDKETSTGNETEKSKDAQKDAKKKEKKDKKEKSSKTSESSSSTPREKPKKEKRGTTGCFGSKKKSKGCDENCQGIIRRQQSMQTIPVRTDNKNEEVRFYDEKPRQSIYTSTSSEMATQVSAQPSKEDSRKKNKQDKEVLSKEDKETGRSREYVDSKGSKEQKNKVKQEQVNKEMSKEGTICSKCGKQKRDCSSGCRNTIIIPYASASHNAIPPGEAESLRMLIKMHSKDTSRQFDNLTAELNYQKSEIRRLNDIYQKMMGSFYDLQKSTGSSKSYNKKTSDVSAKPCGCNFSNQCQVDSQNTSAGKSTSNSYYECNCSNKSNNNNVPTRRFGPPNTAVAINLCDTCNVEISTNRQCPREHDQYDGDKLRKEQFNQSKKAIHADQKIRTEDTSFGGKGDSRVRKADSVSTIYKNDKKHSMRKKGPIINEKDGHENLLDSKFLNQREEEEELEETIKSLPKFKTKTDTEDVGYETDYSEPRKKPKSTYSSRVLIWLKRSWISIKHKTEECRRKDQERQERTKGIERNILNFCQSTAKQAAVGMWKSMKKRKMF